MKNIFKIAATVFIAASALYAVDWGGKLSNDTSFSDNFSLSLKLQQINTAILWISAPLGSKNNDYFAAETLYKFKYDKTQEAEMPITNILDLNLLKFSINRTVNGKGLSFNIGRYFIADATFAIFSQISDGIMTTYEDASFSISAYAGYTGLLNAKNAAIINAPTHTQREYDGDIYALSAHYIPLGAAITVPNAFANQRLIVQGWGFADLNGDSFNRFYLTVSFDGNVLKNFSYTLSSTLGTMNLETLSNLSKLRFMYYPLHFLSLYSENSGKVVLNVGFEE